VPAQHPLETKRPVRGIRSAIPSVTRLTDPNIPSPSTTSTTPAGSALDPRAIPVPKTFSICKQLQKPTRSFAGPPGAQPPTAPPRNIPPDRCFLGVWLGALGDGGGNPLGGEAGGKCSDMRGGPVALRDPHLLADNGTIHKGMLSVFDDVFRGQYRYPIPVIK